MTHTPYPAGLQVEKYMKELEPVVARLLERHLAAADAWLPHAYIPFTRATDFDGPLDGTAWHPDQNPLPQPVRDALMVNLLTEDNLPSYHLELATRMGLDGAWGVWVHRWTAEEARHGEALRAYLHASRAVDPVELEHLRMRHMSAGHNTGQPGLLHGVAYVMVQEQATREAHRNAARACNDPAGKGLMNRIAADENLHMLFYRDLYAAAAEAFPEVALSALADVLTGFTMPGTNLPGFTLRAVRIAAAGIYDLDVHRHHVVTPLLRHLGTLNATGLTPAAAQAQDRIGQYLEKLPVAAERARRLAERLMPRTDQIPSPAERNRSGR